MKKKFWINLLKILGIALGVVLLCYVAYTFKQVQI